MKYITTVLITAFVIISGIYIYNDSQRYKVTPHTVPIIIYEEKVVTNVIEDPNPEQETITDSDRELLARVVMSEGSLLPRHGKIAIVAVIMNRVRSDQFPNTIRDVLYQENQFSLAENGDPTEECYLAIDDYIETGWPSDMYYFRSDKPHSFGYEYLHIGNTYFNTENIFY